MKKVIEAPEGGGVLTKSIESENKESVDELIPDADLNSGPLNPFECYVEERDKELAQLYVDYISALNTDDFNIQKRGKHFYSHIEECGFDIETVRQKDLVKFIKSKTYKDRYIRGLIDPLAHIPKVQELRKAFEQLDLDKIASMLDDDRTYHDQSKSDFVNSLKIVFEKYAQSGITSLKSFKGTCHGCSN